MTIVIAIDGPAASGKGTLSRSLAGALGFAHLDTGALYRAVGYGVLQAGGNPEEEEDAEASAEALYDVIAEHGPSILDNPALRTDEVGVAASKVAALEAVRESLLDLQRDFAESPGEQCKGAVLDGRDIGTVVCPDADIKLFVTAETGIRAERRRKELHSRGITATYEAVLKDMRERDARDADRKVAPMRPADDAVILDTGDMDAEQVFEKALCIVKDRLGLS